MTKAILLLLLLMLSSSFSSSSLILLLNTCFVNLREDTCFVNLLADQSLEDDDDLLAALGFDQWRKKIIPGSLLKAVVRPGGGDSCPVDGDQVIYHCTVRTWDGVVVESMRLECGGRGLPIRDVLGKSKMILGLLEGIPTMHKGEIAMSDKITTLVKAAGVEIESYWSMLGCLSRD